MEFKEIVEKRYACRKFDGRSLPAGKVDELIEMVRLAPSGLNLQPWKIKVVTDQETKKELFPATFDQPQITTCSHVLVFCANTDLDFLISKIEQDMREAGAPEGMCEYVLGLARRMNQGLSFDEKVAWAKSQVYLAVANALLGAKALGFDSCPITSFQPEAYARILRIPEHLVPTLVCPIGYAADTAQPKRRLSKEDIVF
jgi:nitroreductase / dihydropteridine reductase